MERTYLIDFFFLYLAIYALSPFSNNGLLHRQQLMPRAKALHRSPTMVYRFILVPQYLQGIVSRTPTDTEICGCSSSSVNWCKTVLGVGPLQPWIPKCGLKILFCIRGWLNTRMREPPVVPKPCRPCT